MKHTRSILAATLALSLAACSQQTATPVATAPEASAPAAADAILKLGASGNPEERKALVEKIKLETERLSQFAKELPEIVDSD